MAGGIGSRFWPLSRTSMPKQFLDFMGTGKSLIQLTLDRYAQVVPVENIYIVTNEMYKSLVLEHLPMLKPEQVLLEPMRKNTAPCIAYASYKIWKSNPAAKVIVAPSDHLIIKESQFKDVLLKGLDFVTENQALLTLGIKPSRPETGYGYIQINSKKDPIVVNESFRKVKTFTEKPDLEIAKVFFESGDFYWNSGIFIWSVDVILEAFELFLPEVNSLFKDGLGYFGTPEEKLYINDAYAECRNISIDYGIMEKASNVYVLCSEFGWSDLGSWRSLYDLSTKDNHGNSTLGDNVFAYNVKDCLINVPKEKLVVIQGLSDYIVVESDDILLICKKEEEQRIKNFVDDVKIKKGENFV
jgi:mannose-1-phosphate guanylyltransferase